MPELFSGFILWSGRADSERWDLQCGFLCDGSRDGLLELCLRDVPTEFGIVKLFKLRVWVLLRNSCQRLFKLHL